MDVPLPGSRRFAARAARRFAAGAERRFAAGAARRFAAGAERRLESAGAGAGAGAGAERRLAGQRLLAGAGHPAAVTGGSWCCSGSPGPGSLCRIAPSPWDETTPPCSLTTTPRE